MSLEEAKAYYDKVFELLQEHHKWFQQSLPLIASENVTSPAVREAMLTDLGHRYAEGVPGERVYAGCRYIDQIELLANELARKVFKAEFADSRPISGVNANLVVYTAFTKPGDVALAIRIPAGGHISMAPARVGGTAGAVRGLDVRYFPFDEDAMNIDPDETKKLIKSLSDESKPPKLAIFGGSVLLFPQPVKELADAFHDVGAMIMYDAAHVAGLIAGRKFQDPLREGADVVTMSTHKTLPGPQGGLVVSFERYKEPIQRAIFPSNTSNTHLHHIAGKAIALAEIMAFGEEYAERIVRNAKVLAQALYEKGLKVLGEKYGFTESHQVVIDVTDYGLGGDIEQKLEDANIIVNRNILPWDIRRGLHFQNPGGIRMGVQEVTRLMMGPSEMEYIAELITRVIVKGEEPERVRRDVIELRKQFTRVGYCFDDVKDAYAYLKVRGLI